MKKLEALKSKELSVKALGSKFGALMAPTYTINSTHCNITANTPSYDCGDESRDKD